MMLYCMIPYLNPNLILAILPFNFYFNFKNAFYNFDNLATPSALNTAN